MATDRRIPSNDRRHRDPEARERKDDKSFFRPRSRVVAIALGAVVLFSDPGFIGFISSWIADNCF
jgi:hypothetical protein